MLSATIFKRELLTFGTALMFLTRLPVGRHCSGDPLVLCSATRYFPAVGFVVAAVLSVSFLATTRFLPESLSVALVLWVGVLLTGAFHEDGLADVADSAGAFGIERKLEIMRDSRVGTYGSLALILLILVKFVALWELALVNVTMTIAALFAAHVLSRWSSVWLMASQEYARPEAANRVVAEGVDYRRFWHSTSCAVLMFLPIALYVSLTIYLLFPVAWLISAISAYRFRKAYSGITGDCLGASNQLVEAGIYIVILAVAS